MATDNQFDWRLTLFPVDIQDRSCKINNILTNQAFGWKVLGRYGRFKHLPPGLVWVNRADQDGQENGAWSA